MSDTQPTAALAKTHPVTVFRDYFEKRREALGAIIPGTLSLDRVMKVALGAYARTPDLWECSIESVYQAINQAVQLGLEPGGPLGQAYIVPFKNKQTGRKEATLITGYKGLITLMRRSGEVATVEAHVVHKEDKFECQLGTDGFLRHSPAWDREPGPMVAVYAIVTTKDGYKTWEVMRKSQVDTIRNGSAGRNSPAWTGNYEEMARKTVIRRVAKFAPMSIEAATALAEEDDANAKGEPIDVSGLADGALVLPGDDTPEPSGAPESDDKAQGASPATPATNAAPAASAAPSTLTEEGIRSFVAAAHNEVAIAKARDFIVQGYTQKVLDIAAMRVLFTLLLARCKTRAQVNMASDLVATLLTEVPKEDTQDMQAECTAAIAARGK